MRFVAWWEIDKQSLALWGGNTQGRVAFIIGWMCREASWELGSWAFQIPMGSYQNKGGVTILNISMEGRGN